MTLATRVRSLVAGWFPQVGSLPWIGDRIQFNGGASVPTASVGNVLALTGVYRACSLLSDAVSLAPPNVMVDAVGGGRTKANSGDAPETLATLTHADAEMFAFATALTGNGYLKVLRKQDGSAYALRALPPWRVTLEIDTARRLWYRVAADSTLAEPEEILREDDVVHARYRMTGANRYMGVSPAASCSPSFALALQSRDVQRYLFTNLASPGGVLTAPGKLDPVVAKKLQTDWASNYSGQGTGKPAVLSNGLTYAPIIWKAVDAQLLEQVQASIDDIARAYSVPKTFLESGTQMTYASASEATRSLYALALQHFAARCADALAQKLLSREERTYACIEFDLTKLLMLPGLELAQYAATLSNGGVLTPNELRNRLFQLPDIDGGDVLRASTSKATQ